MYAIIETGGKQYKVMEGQTVRVEKLNYDGDKVVFDKVLCVADNGKITVGKPYVEGASVEATVKTDGRSKKVIVYKYKPKKGFHKKQGHRQAYTEVTVTKVVG